MREWPVTQWDLLVRVVSCSTTDENEAITASLRRTCGPLLLVSALLPGYAAKTQVFFGAASAVSLRRHRRSLLLLGSVALQVILDFEQKKT